MNGIFEVVVNFTQFKNIDLFRQGLYCVRATLHSQKPEDEKQLPVGEGLPYYLLNEKKVHDRVSQNKKIVYPAKISDSLKAFYSKTFRVQYVDQEVELEDACLFRFERKARHHNDHCYLALELMFAEYNSTDYAMRKEYPAQNEFEMVSLKWFTINKFHSGHGSGFYPATFDDSHFCLMDVMVHFCLIDYQFRQTTVTLKPSSSTSKQQPTEIICKTFEQSLFPQNMIRPTGNAYTEKEVHQVCDKAHSYYVQRLISAYNSLARLAVILDKEAVGPLDMPKHMLRPKPAPPTSPPPSEDSMKKIPEKKDGKGKVKPSEAQKDSTESKEESDANADTTQVSATKEKESVQQTVTSVHKDPKSKGIDDKATVQSEGKVKSPDKVETSAKEENVPKEKKTEQKQVKEKKALPKVDKKRFLFPALSRFSKRIEWTKDSSKDKKICELVTLMLTKDIKAIAEQNFQLWYTFIRLLPSRSNQIREHLQKEFQTLLHERITCFVFREKFAHKDRWRCAPKDIFSQHQRQASMVRRAWGQAELAKLVLEDALVFPDPEDHVVLFEESFEKSNPTSEYKSSISNLSISNNHFASSPKTTLSSSTPAPLSSPASSERISLVDRKRTGSASNSRESSTADKDSGSKRRTRKGSMGLKDFLKEDIQAVLEEEEAGEEAKHILVFVHGYQGNSWDMRLFKNHLALLFPDHLFLLSSSNEGHTEGDIGEMGARLASEIVEFIVENCPLGFSRLSIIAHSLGGLIARAALARKEMEPYHNNLHTFMSLASPHCGYMYSKNTVLDTGIWVLKKWSKSLCLTQLSMTDNPDHEKCFIYKLSKKKGLEYFQNCLLLASHQDYYSPFHSSRIELHHDALRNQKHGKVYTSMVENLIKPLKRTLKRFNVSFVNKKTNLDSIIGRTAHILFLDNHLYMVMVCYIYRHLFE